MRTLGDATKCICAVFVLLSLVSMAFAAEINPYADSATLSATGTGAELGACKIVVLETYFWRDWMPIVGRPGPDRGSPLHAKVAFSLDNSTGAADRLSFQAVIIDQKGQSHPGTFRVMPNYRILPEAIDNPESWRTMDETAKKAVMAKYNVIWNGELKPGEVRRVELLAADGPFLPVGSRVHIEITLTDQKGNSAVVRTPDEYINRTD